MGKRPSRLTLIDDPVSSILRLLSKQPLKVAARYLVMIANLSMEQGELSIEDVERISALLNQILSDDIRAA